MLRSGSAQGDGISETCSEERALGAAGYLIPIYVQSLARAQGRGSHSAGPFPTDRARGAPGSRPSWSLRLELCRVARTAHVPSLPKAQMGISAQGWSTIQQEAHFACETIATGPAEVKHQF